MSEHDTFDVLRTLKELKTEWGSLVTSKTHWKKSYYQVSIANRLPFLEQLFRMAKEAGIEKHYFTNSRMDEIIEEMIPHGKSITKKAESSWIKNTRDDIITALATTYRGMSRQPQRQEAPQPVPRYEPEGASEEAKPFTKEFDPSTLPERTKIEIVVDPELEKLLGYDSDD